MPTIYNYPPNDENPYAGSLGAARRSAPQIALDLDAPIAADPDAGNWGVETARSLAAGFGNDMTTGVEFLARGLLGDEEGRQDAAKRYMARQQEARAMGPPIQSYADAADAGGGVGDYLAATGYQLAGMLPDMAAVATGVGTGGVLARRGARKAITTAIADTIEGSAANVVAREAAVKTATRQAAITAPDGAGAVSNAMRVAGAQVDEAGRKAAVKEAVEIAGRTPRAGVNPLQATIDAAGTWGGRVGGTVAGIPSLSGESNAEAAADADTSTADMWKLAAGTTAASATQVVPLERFFGKFGKQAMDDVAARAERFVPRAAKEALKQGAMEGSQEVVQQALQNAGHAWVEENLDALTDAGAIDDYIASFVAGGVLGGIMGGGGEAARALGGPVAAGGRKLLSGTKWTRDAIKGRLESYADKLRAQRTNARAGQPMDDETSVPLQGASAADIFSKVKSGLSDAASTVASAGRSALERMRSAAADLSSAESLDADTDGVVDWTHQRAQAFDEGAPTVSTALRAPNTNPVVLDTPLQRVLMAHIATEHPVWSEPEAAQHAGRALEKLLTNDSPTLDDEATYDWLARSGALDKPTLDAWKVFGGEFGDRTASVTAAQRARDAEETAANKQDALPGRLQFDPLAMEDADRRGTRVVTNEDDGTVDETDWDSGITGRGAEPVSGADAMTSAREGIRAVNARLDALHDDKGATGAQLREQRDALNKAHNRARVQLRKNLLGGGSNAVWVENQSNAKSQREFAARTEGALKAGYVEMAEQKNIGVNKPLMRRQLLDLGTLIGKQRAKINAEGTTDENISGKTALMRGLAEAKLAGIAFKVGAFKAGDITSSNTGRILTTLTDSDAAELNRVFDPRDYGTAARAAGKPKRAGSVAPGDVGRVTATVARAEQARIDSREYQDALTPKASREQERGENAAEGFVDPDLYALKPRKSPPGRSVGGEFAPAMGVVSDADVSNPYGDQVARALAIRGGNAPRVTDGAGRAINNPGPNYKLRTQQPLAVSHTPREKAATLHAIGVEIGTAEMARRREAGEISERRFNLDTKQLENPDSGLSKQYLNDATSGRFNTASFRQLPADAEQASGSDGDYALRERDSVEKYGIEGKQRKRGAQLQKAVEQMGRRAGSALTRQEKNAQFFAGEERNPGGAGTKAYKRQFSNPTKQTGTTKVTPPKSARGVTLDQVNGKPKSVDIEENLDADISSITGAPDGDPDHAAEASLLNALMDALGLPHVSHVESMPSERARRGELGSYGHSGARVRISDALTGGTRMDVLLHEAGHHIIRTWLARAAGLNDASELTGLRGRHIFQILKKVDPALAAAMEADFEKWRAANPRSQKPGVVRAGRAALFRGRGLLKSSLRDKRVVSDMTSESQVYAYDFEEWLADHIARALSQNAETQSIIGKFFAGIAKLLRRAYALLADKGNDKWQPAPSVNAWVQSLLDANRALVRDVTGASTTQGTADAAIRAAVVAAAAEKMAHRAQNEALDTADPQATPKFSRENIADLVEFVKYVLPKAERQILDRVFNRAAANMALKRYWERAGYPEFVTATDDAQEGLEYRIALGYLAWQDGAFKTGPQGKQAFLEFSDTVAQLAGASAEGDLAQRVLEDITNNTVQYMHERDKMYSVRELEARAHGAMQQALNWVAKEGPVSSALTNYWTGQYARMRDSGIPALRKLGAVLQRPQGTTGGDDRGLLPGIRTQTLIFHREVAEAFKGLDAGERVRAMSVLQRQAAAGDDIYDKKSAKVRAAIDAMRVVFVKEHAYMRNAGFAKLGKTERYFPVLMDMKASDAAAKLTVLYSQPHYKDNVLDLFGVTSSKERADDAVHARLVQRLVAAAAWDGNADPAARESEAANASARAMNHRLSRFIYDARRYDADGNLLTADPRTAEQKRNDLRTFASLQTKNIDEMFARHFVPMVKAAEFRSRFGGKSAEGEQTARGRLDAILADVRKQGGTDSDVKFAEDAVKAALGSYGVDGSPTLAAFSPGLAKKFSGPRSKAVIQGGQAYQNLRLLPLALLSSLVDPMGIAVRTGGDFSATWAGFKTGIRSITNKQVAKEMLAALDDLGMADDFMPAIASHPVFDGQETAFARKINEGVFKWNGMSAWVRATRVMALHAGHRFLLKHAGGADTQSKRYLDELSLTPHDINEDPSAPGKVVLNDKTRAALRQLVDEAILRPNSLQVPLWHRDPYMGLVTQYKSFAYAIYDQISSRVVREVNHGNFRVLLAAMAYVPIALMAELLRELIQYGPDGNPNRKEWGPGDYTMLAAERTGLSGPKMAVVGDTIGDVKRRNLPGTSQLGPTGGQARNVLDAFQGRRDLGKEAEAALPASAGWRRWNDGTAGEVPQGVERRSAGLVEVEAA